MFYRSGNLGPKVRATLTLQTDRVMISLESEESEALELGAEDCQREDRKVASQGPSADETPLKHSRTGYSTGAEGLGSTKPVYGGTQSQLTVCLRLTALPRPPQEWVSPSP